MILLISAFAFLGMCTSIVGIWLYGAVRDWSCSSFMSVKHMDASAENISEDLNQVYGLGLTPQWTPDSAHIVFPYYGRGFHIVLGDPSHVKEGRIQVVAQDGSSLASISETERFAIDHSPSISPDGSRIVYSAYEFRQDEPSYFHIETSAPDGTDKRGLTKGAVLDYAPLWSPDGARIAFLRADKLSGCSDDPTRRGIYSMKADGSDVRRLVLLDVLLGYISRWPSDELSSEFVGSPAWSPDGQAIAFLVVERMLSGDDGTVFRQTSLDMVNVDGSGRRRLLAGKEQRVLDRRDLGPIELNSSPAWSPDGQRIAFLKLDDEGRRKLYTIGHDGADLREVVDPGTTPNPRHSGRVSWSPDGSQIMFFIFSPYSSPRAHTLYVVNADGSNLRVLDIGMIVSANWSPDGSRIAVVTTSASYSQYSESDVVLYTMTPAGSDVQVLAQRKRNTKGVPIAVGPDQRRSVDVASCSAGVVAPNPGANPGLVQDCEALVMMIDRIAVVGLNWDADTPIVEWEGVSLEAPVLPGGAPGSEEQLSPLRVRGLSLPERGLIGAFPLSVTELGALQTLELSDNALSGAVPPELGRLTELRILDLGETNLSGTIPVQLANLANLHELTIDGNLEGPIPPELGGLLALEYLNLSLTGPSVPIPPELGNLENLRTLNLRGRGIGGSIPPELGNLENLRELVLVGKLSGSIPPELGNLTELETLDLRNNDLSGSIPRELANLTSLERLDIQYNFDLVGCAPEALYERGVYIRC